MRVLSYNVKGAGHVNPTLPLARGLIAGAEPDSYSASRAVPPVGSTFAPSGAERAKNARDMVDHELGPFARRDGRRRVYASMGTVVGGEAGLDSRFFAPFAPFVEAFRGRDDAKLLLSVGKKLAPEALGPLPENVIRKGVPQLAVLEHTDAFITHAGANSMHEGLFHGVPLVCVHHMGDQPHDTRTLHLITWLTTTSFSRAPARRAR